MERIIMGSPNSARPIHACHPTRMKAVGLMIPEASVKLVPIMYAFKRLLFSDDTPPAKPKAKATMLNIPTDSQW